MRVSQHRFLSALGFSGLFLFLAITTPASDQDSTQMVRLSFVEGDVRLSRGVGNLPDLSTTWQQAEANVPVAEGFSLATVQGAPKSNLKMVRWCISLQTPFSFSRI